MSRAAGTQDAGMGMRLALDLGPLVVYFAAYALTHHNIFVATGLFMAATIAAMGMSWLRYHFCDKSHLKLFKKI